MSILAEDSACVVRVVRRTGTMLVGGAIYCDGQGARCCDVP